MSEYVSVDDIVKRYKFHAMEKAEKEISQIIYEVKKHNEDMIPVSELEEIKAEIRNCIKVCENLMNGNYPMIESNESLTNRILTYKQCIDFIDNHLNKER